MDYNNLFYRFLTSLFLVCVFFSFIFYLDNFLWVLFLLIYLTILYEVKFFFRNNYYKFLIYIYLLFSFIFLQLYLFYFYISSEIIIIFLTISIFDTFSYLIGSKFGHRKIFTSISPNKSYVGLIGGIFATLAFLFLIKNYFISFNLNYSYYLISLIILLSFMGDVLESYFKRLSGIKNSSNFLPGHGGFFDRFDSFIMCTYVIFFYNLLNGN